MMGRKKNRSNNAKDKDKAAQNVAKQLVLACQKLKPLYKALDSPAQLVRAEQKPLIQLHWGIDRSMSTISSVWSSLESELSRVMMGLVSDLLIW